jgi:hypothetical protein
VAQLANRRRDEACPYQIVDAHEACPRAACGRRGQRVREERVIRSQALLLAIGIGLDGRRSIQLADRASRSSCRECLPGYASVACPASSSRSRTTTG